MNDIPRVTVGFWYEIEGRPFANENTKSRCAAKVFSEFYRIIKDERLVILDGPFLVYHHGGRILDFNILYRNEEHFRIQLFSTIGIKAIIYPCERCSIKLAEGISPSARGVIELHQI